MITRPTIDADRLANYLDFVPFDVTKDSLYNAATLYQGYDIEHPETYATCYDQQVYRHYIDNGKQTSNPLELLARSLHDYGMTMAIKQMLGCYAERAVVGIMGGHGLKRTDSAYRQVVEISKRLTEGGFLMTTGGGPGAMEATHLGAWMAGYKECDVDAVMNRLCYFPCFKDTGWFDSAMAVIRDYPQDEYESLGIPTWLYGHEPSTPFATHIAKYFENSIREDTLLTVAYGGIIFSPGSAGTMQEIFQEAVQNHYLSFGYASPMVFLGKKFWTEEMPAYPMLSQLMETGRYKNLLLHITDDAEEAVEYIKEFSKHSLL